MSGLHQIWLLEAEHHSILCGVPALPASCIEAVAVLETIIARCARAAATMLR
jgi:hypothetical protein